MITLVKVLHNILFAAGYLAIAVLASVISYSGKPELGLGIILAATAMLATLLIASAVINRRHKRAVQAAQSDVPVVAAGRTKTYSAHASETYEHDAQTVWSLIRPAESAVLLSDAQRAFTVPGTPAGVGEQQCFIDRDGSVSIIEVIGEESPWWATTRPISPGETNTRSTYRLKPTSTGCVLTVGTVMELPANAVLTETPEDWWETLMRPYLTRVKEVLAAGQN
ncbi:hypothetical protein [Arthrobacter sp. B10-11]|uniref:hypothetical protein n=1 Tax=Arthrobacter sp. B10-11 TaxID=3081160 RepID=UPI002952FE6D|nr:hypothetical protein [Arthrobacter sp. B10-11]MDV8149694.1 hypothetical protein [Arthrobacter sp. B10-11]